MVRVIMPVQLRTYCRLDGDVHVSAGTVQEVLRELQRERPELYGSICDETGAVRRHINVFVNSDLVRSGESHGMQTVVQDDDILTIWTAVSGG